MNQENVNKMIEGYISRYDEMNGPEQKIYSMMAVVLSKNIPASEHVLSICRENDALQQEYEKIHSQIVNLEAQIAKC